MNASLNEIAKINQILGRGYLPNGEARPLTDAEFFEISWEMGANQLNTQYRALFHQLAQWIFRELTPKTALEIGCGPGYLLHCLNQLGIQTIGVDGNPFSRELFTQEHPQYAQHYLLDKAFENDYAPIDVLISIECFEHIPDAGLHASLEKIAAKLKPQFIVFSSTPYADPNPDWDIQWGHINLKSEAQWIALFSQFGYEVVPNVTPPITPWALLFQNRSDYLLKPYHEKNSSRIWNKLKRVIKKLPK